MKKYWPFFALLLLSGCLLPGQREDDSSQLLNVELTGAHRKGNRIDVAGSQDRVVLNVNSASGIGKATISPVQDNWPSHIVFRLHLRGLESLSINNGELTIATSIQSHSPYRVTCETRLAGQPRSNPASKTSPWWMPARLISKDGGNSVIPLEKGYIEVILPEVITRNQPKRLSIQWVDFWR